MQITGRQQGLTITPIWRLAFRPFFLFGMGFAALAVPLWVLALNGYLVDFAPASGWLNWHQHELIFGFAENPRASRYKDDYALLTLLT
ncbi:NnrS family protein [Denitrificimonas caeni]|uniref:NnrS family protein n=1 Tax=Denitrificimonas caeni TaxID=521720 RepID=UPI0003B5A2CD